MEEWREITGYEGLYQVSSEGRVKSLSKLSRCDRWGKPRYRKSKEKLLKSCITHNGYYMVKLSKDGKKIGFTVGRLIAIAFIPNPENKSTVNHKDGIKTNDYLCNLEWATQSENTIHAYRNGLIKSQKGVPKSPEHIENMRKCRLGHKMSEETKAKMSILWSGKNNPFYGKHHSEETRNILRIKMRQRPKPSEETKEKTRQTMLRTMKEKREKNLYS